MSKLSKRNHRRTSQGEARPFEGMRQVHPHAAGVDSGAHEIMACVPDGDDQHIVRAFGTYTADLDALADWFVDRGIQTVAMESTAVCSAPRRSRMCQAAKAPCSTVSGCKPGIAMGC